MVLVIFYFAENVEEENAHIFVEVFMIEEEFGEESQVLAVYWVFIAVDLENCDLFLYVSIDFVAGRVVQGTALRMPFQF